MSLSFSGSLFADDSFFENSLVLWPTGSTALSSLREDLLQRRARLLQNLRTQMRRSLWSELSEDLHSEFLHGLHSLFAFSSPEETQRKPDIGPEDAILSGNRPVETGSSSTVEADLQSQPEGSTQAKELPDHLEPSSVRCSLDDDGLPRIESEEERAVPIRFRTSLEFSITRDGMNTTEPEDGAETTRTD